jgi:parallel beta-helix repeat protein
MNTFSLIVMMMLLTSIFALAPNIRQVRALETIYIRADGSVEGTTDIQTSDNVTYAFVADINGSIVVERNNIVIDGSGHTLQGTRGYNSEGIDLSGTANVKIKSITIKDFNYGIMLNSSLNVTISGNNLTHNVDTGGGGYGIYLYSSSDNTISENNMTSGGAGVSLRACSNNMISGNHVAHNSGVGIWLGSSTNNTISANNVTNDFSSVFLSNSSNNMIYHNNFVDNTQRVHEEAGAINTWDDGYPSGGNFWSDYERYGSSSDFSRFDSCSGPFQNVSGSDGIIDAPYSISTQNFDRYPLAFHYNQPNPPRASFNFSSSIQAFDGYWSEFSQSLVETGLPITFDASLSHGTWNGTSQEPIVEYNWDFGDGNLTSTTDSTIIHVYEIHGRLNVTLGIVDAEGSTSSSYDMIRVFMPTSISVSIEAPSSVLGFSVAIYGRLNDIHGVGLSDELVVLYYTLPGVQNWYPISSTMTDDDGNYSVLWIPSATGCFFLKAEWNGNTTHIASNGTVTLSVIYQNTYAFSVESNSTVSGLAFNMTTQALGFSVSGETGTTGYARITIAKALVPNITDLEVRIDGVEYSYFAVSLDDSWLLTFTYNHSSHQVNVYLDKSIIPEFPTFPVLLLFMATVLLLTCAAARRKTPKRSPLHDQGSIDNA